VKHKKKTDKKIEAGTRSANKINALNGGKSRGGKQRRPKLGATVKLKKGPEGEGRTHVVGESKSPLGGESAFIKTPSLFRCRLNQIRDPQTTPGP